MRRRQPPGTGGLIRPPVNAPAGQATPTGIQPGPSSPLVRARQVLIAGPGEELLVYSPSAGAGNLLFSITNLTVPGLDEFGNHVVPLTGWYDNAGGFFTQIGAGFITFGTGSLAGGWTGNADMQNDGSGNLLLSATGNLFFNGTMMTVP